MLENILASLVAGALLVGIGMAIQWWRFRSTTSIKVFDPEPNGAFNTSFYTYFCRQIERAHEDILITGEGFGYSGSSGEAVAERFEQSMRKALEKGVLVKRYQSASSIHPRWASHLRGLLVDFPGRFTLFIVGGKSESHIASFCVIDSDTRHSVSEFMLSRRRDFGDTSENLAATAVFLHGVGAFATALRSNLISIERQRNVRHIVTPSNLDEVIEKAPPRYFAYGSNMDESQMLERCPGATRIGVGKLSRHRVTFNRKGSYRDGSVASIEATPDVTANAVYGVVWEMTHDEFAEMDKFEDPSAYERITVIVSCAGLDLVCDTYRAFSQDSPPKPDEEYVRLMLDAVTAAELPSSYIEQLKQWLVDFGWKAP